jgi:NAD(P)-dependent dehydrogenase (short-subunit alcohol dehydrogenase family)
MGAAAARILADLGAEVYTLDVRDIDRPVGKAITADLRDPVQIDAALDAIGAPVHALFSCAGVSGVPFSPLEVMQINFIGARHLVERAADEMMPEGSAVAMISSIGGVGWADNLAQIKQFLATPDFASASAWISEHFPDDPDADSSKKEMDAAIMYGFSKQVMNVYVQMRAIPFVRRGIRINATGPCPTATPLYAATPMWDAFGGTEFRAQTGLDPATAEDQAFPLVFLNCDAARFVNGAILNVDAGLIGGALVGEAETILVKPLE